MFSRRNLLGALAGLIPSLLLLKPTLSVQEELPEWDSEGKRLILLPNHCYMYEHKNGNKSYSFCGMLHREDGPAFEYLVPGGESSSWRKEWWFKGERHRIGGPAIETAWEKQWWVHGKLHRLDGPAIEDGKNTKWFRHGKCHREDGPALEYANGSKYWYRNGDIHREDGPAVISHLLKRKDWYLNGKCYRIEMNGIEMPI